jgi:hypothetical protein
VGSTLVPAMCGPRSRLKTQATVRKRREGRSGIERGRVAWPNGMVGAHYELRRGGGMADASVSKTDVRKDVRVRLPLSAPRRTF